MLEGYRTYDRQWSNMNLQVTLTRRCLLLKQIVAAARARKIIRRGYLQQEEGLVMNLTTQKRLPAAVNQQLPLLLPVITKDKLTLVERWRCHRAFTQGATSSVHRFPILIRWENYELSTKSETDFSRFYIAEEARLENFLFFNSIFIPYKSFILGDFTISNLPETRYFKGLD